MKVKAQVTIELEAPDLDSVGDLVHEVWGDGDPGDSHSACITVDDVRQVESFSWERPS